MVGRRRRTGLAVPPSEIAPPRAASELVVLLLDGWLMRQRGPGWGFPKTSKPRVEWHELKIGMFYRHTQGASPAGGRGRLAEKVGGQFWLGGPLEVGRRLHTEALRVGEGARWIGKVATDPVAGDTEGLEFYHASQHLWELGCPVSGDDNAAMST